MKLLHDFIARLDWKRAYAVTCVAGYAYQILLWPPLFWVSSMLTLRLGEQWPSPPLLPWEHLAVATANLAVIGGVQLLRDRERQVRGATDGA